MSSKGSNTMVATENVQSIHDCIFTVRGVQVMLDRDIAELYGVPTKALNQAVKRNADRFPEGFVFQLTQDEFDVLRSQLVTSNESSHLPQCVLRSQLMTSKRGGLRYRPYAFTEHGIVMLASLLKSKTASEVSVRIVNAFVAMRKFILANAQVFQRIESVEQRQIATEGKVNDILNRLNTGEVPEQRIFYDGQLWDARALILKLIGNAKRSLILIDNWATPEVLDLFAKKREGVKVTIFTSEHYDKNHVPHRKISPADIKTFNAQYPKLAVRYNETFHDRFLIIDDRELYLIGASLKDLGKKCFGFTKMDAGEIRRIKKAAFAP
ncbi:MAG: ORF6N domain-containing protein [Kiritimatiellae bacterium]|nr:ORF6N domain-containing protein [Kiritimatiellia bacterium]